jgi:hypothetical protein
VAAFAAAVYLTIALTQLRMVPDGPEQVGAVERKEQAGEK